MDSKIVNGNTYVQTHNLVRKLTSLEKDPYEYVFVSYYDTPINDDTYIATVRDENNKEFLVYMPGDIVRESRPNRRFVYEGLHKIDDKWGSYHMVLWEEEWDLLALARLSKSTLLNRCIINGEQNCKRNCICTEPQPSTQVG